MYVQNVRSIKYVYITCVFSGSKCTKTRFRPPPDPAGELARPKVLSRLWSGHPLPIPLPSPRLRRLNLGVCYDPSVLRPFEEKFLATLYDTSVRHCPVLSCYESNWTRHWDIRRLKHYVHTVVNIR